MIIDITLNLYSTIIWTLGCTCILLFMFCVFDYYYSHVNRSSWFKF